MIDENGASLTSGVRMTKIIQQGRPKGQATQARALCLKILGKKKGLYKIIWL